VSLVTTLRVAGHVVSIIDTFLTRRCAGRQTPTGVGRSIVSRARVPTRETGQFCFYRVSYTALYNVSIYTVGSPQIIDEQLVAALNKDISDVNNTNIEPDLRLSALKLLQSLLRNVCTQTTYNIMKNNVSRSPARLDILFVPLFLSESEGTAFFPTNAKIITPGLATTIQTLKSVRFSRSCDDIFLSFLLLRLFLLTTTTVVRTVFSSLTWTTDGTQSNQNGHAGCF